MKQIVQDILEKRGIDDVTQLDPAEAAEFDNWNRILSEGEMTVDKIKIFCESEKHRIESQWSNLDNSNAKNERLILLHTVYSKIIEVAENKAGKAKVEQKERELRSLLDNEI